MRERIRAALAPPPDAHQVVAGAPVVAVRVVFRRFWPYARPYWKWMALGLVATAALPAIETAGIWLFKLVVDEVLVPRDLGPLPWILLAYLGITLAAGVIGFVDDLIATWVGERFLLDLRSRVFDHVQRLSPASLERRKLGDVLARLTGDVEAIEGLVVSGVTAAVSALVRVLFFAGALFVLDWRLALVSLVVTPVFLWVARRFSRLIKRAAREERRRAGSLGAIAEESLGNVALVQSSNAERREFERFHREGEGIVGAEMAAARLKALFSPVVDLIELVGVALVIGFGTWILADGGLTLGGLLVFLAYLSQLYSPVRELGSLTNSVFTAAAGAERLVEVLDERPLVHERPDAIALDRTRGELAIERVTFTYPGAETPALRDLDLHARPGQTVALVGASGAGKSTVAKLLLRFHDPDSGTIRIDGRDVRDVTLASLRDNVGVLLQETLVLDASVRENIAYGRPDADDDDVVAAARAAGADEFVRALPDGYDTVLGQRGRRLSGGQRQRIAIARALLRDAPVLVLDEPSTGLDAEATARLREPLRRLLAGRTAIVISHNLLTVREADEIVVLDRGEVVERGRHDDLVAAGGRYARMVALQQLGVDPEQVSALEPRDRTDGYGADRAPLPAWRA